MQWPALEGRAAIQAWNEAQAALGTLTQATFTPEQIDGRGDLAFVRGTFSMTMTPEGAFEPIQITGKYVEIKRKQADGSCARLMAESDPWIRLGCGYEECLAACQPHPDTLLFVARDGTCRQTESVV